MAVKKRTHTRAELVSHLEKEARKSNISASLANEAIRRTLLALRLPAQISGREFHRAHAYFWAVIRGQATRRNSDAYLHGKFLLSSIIADLRQSGFSDERILSELEKDWASRVPREVMNEFRAKLMPLEVAI